MSSSYNGTTEKDIPNAEAHGELYHAGIEMRRKVMGDEHVNHQLKTASEFSQPMQQLACEVGWGTIWSRPGLDLKQRSLISIALLVSRGHPNELTAHVKGAVNNGATEIEIRETLLQAAVYCGLPSGMASFRIADAAIQTLKDEGKLPK